MEEPKAAPVPVEEPKAARFGVADLHGCLATLAGLGVLAISLFCCVHPFRNQYLTDAAFGLGTVAIWTGLFGVVTRGSLLGRALAWLGLGVLACALALACFGGGLERLF